MALCMAGLLLQGGGHPKKASTSLGLGPHNLHLLALAMLTVEAGCTFSPAIELVERHAPGGRRPSALGVFSDLPHHADPQRAGVSPIWSLSVPLCGLQTLRVTDSTALSPAPCAVPRGSRCLNTCGTTK